jgi:hypothetical protein
MLKTASPSHHKFHNTKECREPPLVMARWYGPLWDPATSKRSWIQTQWCAGETPAGPLPMSLTWGVPRASQVRSAVILQKGKKRNAERCILLGFSV